MSERKEGLDVKCPNCRQAYLETTAEYDPAVKANGTMVRLKNPWKKLGWAPFGDGVSQSHAHKKSRSHFNMYCPGCGGMLCRSGFLKVIEPKTTETAEMTIGEQRIIISDEVPPDKVIVINPDDIKLKQPKPGPKTVRNNKIFELKDSGMSKAAIGREVGLSGMMVGKILKERAANDKG